MSMRQSLWHLSLLCMHVCYFSPTHESSSSFFQALHDFASPAGTQHHALNSGGGGAAGRIRSSPTATRVLRFPNVLSSSSLDHEHALFSRQSFTFSAHLICLLAEPAPSFTHTPRAQFRPRNVGHQRASVPRIAPAGSAGVRRGRSRHRSGQQNKLTRGSNGESCTSWLSRC